MAISNVVVTLEEYFAKRIITYIMLKFTDEYIIITEERYFLWLIVTDCVAQIL